MKHRIWREVAASFKLELDSDQLSKLDVYERWLIDEATSAGGIGPDESDRVWLRHIADALLFGTQMPDSDVPVLDLGSGVGLPGIPLAVTMPHRDFTLIDRSGRRIDLLGRVSRILELDNIDIRQQDLHDIDDQHQLVVSRATLTPSEAESVLKKVLSPGGLAILGGSWVSEPTEIGWETVEVGSVILDQPVWLLIMRHS